MSKITLTDLVNLTNQTTAVNAINSNNAVLKTASDNTLSRDGTSPNTMSAFLDMNSNQIINLPLPATAGSPVRLQDVQAGATVTNIPPGGTTGQVLAKSSNTDYQVGWTSESAELVAGTNIVLTGTTPTTISTTTTPTFTTVNTAIIPTVVDTLVGKATTDVLTNKTYDTAGTGNSFLINGLAATANTGTGSVVRATSPTITTPTLSTPTLTTPVLGTPSSGTLTSCTGLPISTGVSGLATNVATFLATPNSANLIAAMTDETGTGANVFATSPTMTTPNIVGTSTNDNAAAGSIGEYVEAQLALGSATSLTTSTAKTITNISLTAGDWDVSGDVYFFPANTTTVTVTAGCLSTVTNTFDTTNGRFNQNLISSTGNGSNFITSPLMPYRFSLSGTTSIFLVALITFAVSTCTGYGIIRARRIR